MTESDREYFARRASEERLAADGASHPAAASAHRAMAARYDDLSIAIARDEQRIVVPLHAA